MKKERPLSNFEIFDNITHTITLPILKGLDVTNLKGLFLHESFQTQPDQASTRKRMHRIAHFQRHTTCADSEKSLTQKWRMKPGNCRLRRLSADGIVSAKRGKFPREKAMDAEFSCQGYKNCITMQLACLLTAALLDLAQTAVWPAHYKTPGLWDCLGRYERHQRKRRELSLSQNCLSEICDNHKRCFSMSDQEV
jgi:hypothetical protein